MASEEFERTVALVEALIQGYGLDPKEVKVQSSDELAVWNLQRGSAAVLIVLRDTEESAFLQVVSPIVTLPEENREAFYEHLLRLNMEELVNCAFAINGDEVVVTTDRSTDGLDRNEVEEMLTYAAKYADQYDDLLEEQFGARRLGSDAEG